MKNIRITLSIIVFFIITSEATVAQNSALSFSNYSVEEGLSSGTVYSIIKDSYGFLWLGTEDGLNRFNGTSFKVYRHEPGNLNSLSANQITSLYESKNGCIWIGTNGGGLSYYDRNRDSVFSYHASGPVQVGGAVTSVNGDRDGMVWVTCFGSLFIINPTSKELLINSKYNSLLRTLNGKVSTCVFQDSQHNTWVGTDEGLYLYSQAQNKISVFRHQENDTNSLAGNNVNTILEDKSGAIWVSTGGGISRLNPNGNSFTNITQTTLPLRLLSNNIYALATDNKNRLWIGTQEGLNILDLTTQTVSAFTPDKRNSRSLSSRSIRSVFADNQGIYWIGTFRGGLDKYDENFTEFGVKQYNAFDSYGLRSPIVTSFAPFGNDVFVGTDGGGLHLYHPTTGLFDAIPLPKEGKNGQQDITILALETDSAGTLWAGSYANGLYRYNPSSHTIQHYTKGEGANDLNNNDVFCLKQDHFGNVWAGTNGGGINIIRKADNRIEKLVHTRGLADISAPSSNFIRAFEEDNSGQMWIGTFGAGISVFNPNTRQFAFYTKENSGLPGNYILSIKKDSRGNIWAGTSGNGLGLLRKDSPHWESITEKDGLANGYINKILEDKDGKIWVSTNKGLSCYDRASGKFKNYSRQSSLQAGAFVSGAGIALANGDLYFGGQNGFNSFNPAELKTNRNMPKLVLTDLKIDNRITGASEKGAIRQPLLLAKEIHISYDQSFSIGFEALDYTVPQANQYEYKMEGYDRDWVSPGKEHSAYYAKLPPGEYTFRVRASNNDGIWNQEGRSIQVIVSPPFWRTTYAYLFYAFSGVFLLLYIRRRGIRKLQMQFEIEQERQQAKQLIEQQQKEAEYLRKLDGVKIKFLTNLSHEFRTPISLIMGPVDNLLTIVKDEAPKNQLNLIKRNSRRLLNLVNQLLDFRKMEENGLQLQCSEGDLVAFVKDIRESFVDLAKQKRIDFGFTTQLTSLLVYFDHAKMERILFNLLSNAFKFTPDNGSIYIGMKISGTSVQEDVTNVVISVKDSGIGIPKESQERIFENFFQHNTNPKILNQGTGIGLAITRELVNIHKGFIHVESEPEQGSTFTFELPLQNGHEAENKNILPTTTVNELSPPLTEAKPSASHEQPSLLIVEDDEDFRFYIKENLKHLYRIYEASNGKEGWQHALFHHPDMIVCDIQMPVMNGLELAQKLKFDKRTQHIPVILLTAANTPSGAIDGLETGAIDYITKPFDFSLLQAKIQNILLLNQVFKNTYTKQVTVTLPKTETVSENELFLQKATSYVYENLDDPQLSVENLSAHLCISRASLYNRIMEITGTSPVEFIRNVKLEKARDLLQKTDKTITEIAYETGFSNANYFTKVFKAKYNMKPSECQAGKRKKDGVSKDETLSDD